MLTHWRLKMDSMMDVIKRYNPIKIQQLFANEHVVLRNIPMTYCSGFDKLLQILIPDDHANTTGCWQSQQRETEIVCILPCPWG